MGNRLFIITGGNFKNSGAESMLLITISELRNRFPNCDIIVDMPKVDGLELNFTQKEFSWGMWEYATRGIDGKKAALKRIIKKFIGRKENFSDYEFLRSNIRKASALVDISGLALTSQWDKDISLMYLKTVKAANSHNVPVFLMPQSFGPFDFGENQREVDRLINCELNKAKVIFAREQSGFDTLTKTYGLKNVIKSCDLVLQNKKLDVSLAVQGYPVRDFNIPNNAVAVIPNLRAFERDKTGYLMDIYVDAIRLLCDNGKKVVLLRHSTEDIDPCERIFEHFKNDNAVLIIKEDLNCVEYSSIIDKFDFIIASRYHSIVHSYKKGIPALVLGWAEKYHELVSMFNQNDYIFDVRNNLDKNSIVDAVNRLCKNYKEESIEISNRLPAYQELNCFDFLSKLMD